MKLSNFVVIDLETTGLDIVNDDIIEIGAVLIQQGRIAAQFSTLVNPHRKLEPLVIRLTGIDDSMLENQPDINEACEKLSSFIGDAIIIAHNSHFDRSFLNRYIPFEQQWIDSIILSQIAFPSFHSYALGYLCETLSINNNSAHRALSDALATAELFIRSVEAIAALPINTKSHLLALAIGDNSPLGQLITTFSKDATTSTDDPSLFAPNKTKSQPNTDDLHNLDDQYIIPVEQIEDFFAAEGICASRMSGFEYRTEQAQMAVAVAESFNSQHFLIAEAGTGTGKSLAYLLPAALLALNSGQKVAVSTYTINLQEQLLLKDIPLLEQILDKSISAALLKGRSNYLCRRLYQYHLNGVSDENRYFIMRVAVWLGGSTDGDVSGLSLNSYDKWKWQSINASRENCLSSCPYHKNGCFLQQARRAAEAADICIINHSLLVANATMEKGFLPEIPYLIIDEAHHLEKAAGEQLSEEGNYYEIKLTLSHCKKLLDTMALSLPVLFVNDTDAEEIISKINMSRKILDSLSAQANQFFNLVSESIAAEAAATNYYPAKVRIVSWHRQQSGWQLIIDTSENISATISQLKDQIYNLTDLLSVLEEQNGITVTGREELHKSTISLLGIKTLFEQWNTGDEINQVYWVELASADKLPTINIAPIELGELLKSNLMQQSRSIIFTSATMADDGSFTYFKNRLGLDLLDYSPEELIVPSPFYYEDQSLFLICNSLPDLSKSSEITCVKEISKVLIKLITAAGGRTLVLFTSYSQLRAVYDQIKQPLAAQSITVLAHKINGEPVQLLNRLQSEQACCILGANSFWEGIDVIGSPLSLLIVVRLPFWPPNTPLAVAKMEKIEAAGGNSFRDYSLPQAIIRFRQGFGRLIRSATDTGAFCVLDGRIISKFYGQRFIDSLPQMHRIQGDADDLAQQIKKWLA